ncbi:MAG: glycosyltransferase family 4 protein [Spirochaetia bacterium]|nr:glycosyltransferase family 4 protein [Spirochaetia bacterium]
MKRIAVNAIYLTGSYPSSGFGRYLGNILSELSLQDLVNEYVLYSPSPLFGNYGAKFKNVVLKPVAGRKFVDVIAESRSFENERPDFLFLAHAEFPKPFPADSKIVVTVHDIIPALFLGPEFLLRGKTPLAMLSLHGLLDRLTLGRRLKKIHRIATVSETSRRDLGKLFGQEVLNKTEVIYNGVDPAFRVFSEEECRKDLKEQNLNYKSYFIYFGGHTVRKNLGRAVQAYQSLPEEIRQTFPLIAIGEGYWKNWILKRNLGKNVRFLPKVPLESLTHLVSGAFASLYPSLYEGFGFPVVESLRAGTWPLVSETSASREILGNAFEMADPWDWRAFRRLMLKRLETKDSVKTEMERLVASIPWDRFSWSAAAKKFMKIWESDSRN